MTDQPPVYTPGSDAPWFAPEAPPDGGNYGGVPLERQFDLTGSAPGFKYDEATLHSLVKDWTDLANEFQEDVRNLEFQLLKVKGPGNEYASAGHADRVNDSIKALMETHKDREKYCRAMTEKYVTALGKYATAEETGSHEVKQASGGIL
ncbi:hypothetical protein [Amycolatopsis samaneae]|uniref:PE domain-containing protein n=1 Tax=Amycolatopsis samaneae TaxID=664691 RepID=A0ABW5GCS1_9PSEU